MTKINRRKFIKGGVGGVIGLLVGCMPREPEPEIDLGQVADVPVSDEGFMFAIENMGQRPEYLGCQDFGDITPPQSYLHTVYCHDSELHFEASDGGKTVVDLTDISVS